MSEKIDYSKGIYDARQLGAGRMFILGVQHMFAMFGATVLVPLDRKSTRLNSSHYQQSRMPSSA